MRALKRFFRHENAGLLFALPACVYMLVFVGYPIISNLLLSLQDVTVANLSRGEKHFIGIANYVKLFHDDVFLKSLGNTLLFTVSCLVFQFLIGFILALFLNKNFSFARTVRGILMIPWMIPMTVTALIFKLLFSQNIDWLTSSKTAMLVVIIANVWIGIPFNTILLSTGLTTIPQELYESAAIDGASASQSFWRITLPLLRPTIESVLVLGFIYTFKVYDLVYVMTSGGPVNSTHLLSTYSYKQSFELFNYSIGSAVANVLLLILLMVGIIYLRITMQGEED